GSFWLIRSPIVVPGLLRLWTNWMSSCSACAIELRLRFWNFARIASRSGPLKLIVGVGMLKLGDGSVLNQYVDESTDTSSSTSSESPRPARTPFGEICRATPKPPCSEPEKKPVGGVVPS